MQDKNKNTIELSEEAKKEAVAIATAAGKLDKRAIAWRVAREKEGMNSRQLALAFKWPLSLVNGTDNRTLCAVKGLPILPPATADNVVRALGGRKEAVEKPAEAFMAATFTTEAVGKSEQITADLHTAVLNEICRMNLPEGEAVGFDKFQAAYKQVAAKKAAAKAGDGKVGSGGGLTADEKVLGCITANRAEMTAAGKAAAIAALS